MVSPYAKLATGCHCNETSIQEFPQDVPHYNQHYEPLRTQPICLPYKANAQENFWDNQTGVITGYAHQDKAASCKAATYLGKVYILRQ